MFAKIVAFIKSVFIKAWAVIKAVSHQVWALITDKDWDLDPQKLIGFIVAGSGAVIFVVVAIRYAIGGPIDSTAAGIGIGAIAAGGGLLGWRNHTDTNTSDCITGPGA
jgi:hypothetical protein